MSLLLIFLSVFPAVFLPPTSVSGNNAKALRRKYARICIILKQQILLDNVEIIVDEKNVQYVSTFRFILRISYQTALL